MSETKTVILSAYDLKKIPVRLVRRFPQCKVPNEPPEENAMFMMNIEGNILQTYLEHPQTNTQAVEEGLRIALYSIYDRLTGESHDPSKVLSEANSLYRHAILYAVDPFENDEIMSAVKQDPDFDLQDKDSLLDFYAMPIEALLRVLDSLQIRNEMHGYNGYLKFLSTEFIHALKPNGKLTFACKISPKTLDKETLDKMLEKVPPFR
ncbi:MAG: hypothetical protein IJ228_01360 [Succinivibrio sp.]|nr:hypothetical protein [Succinivibrio sp.]